MKKIIILSMILILGISLMAFAGAEKIVFEAGEAWDGSINGFVIVNPTPDGATTTTIQIQVRDAQPKYEYWVYSGGQLLGTFVTNKNGQGGMHCNLPFELLETEDDLGKYINIWNDEGGTVGEIDAERELRARLPLFVVTQDSGQNDINRGLDMPHINWKIDGLCIEFEFVNPTYWTCVYDYRVDGEEGETHTWSDMVIGEGELVGQLFGLKYNWVVVPPYETKTVQVCAEEEVWVGMRVGAEQKWYLDWIIFEVQ